MRKVLRTDVLVIGGGITGAVVARELTKYRMDVTLVEKSPNLCAATSKGSHAMIYWGAAMATSLLLKSIMLPSGSPIYDPELPFLKAAREGFQAFDQLAHELDIPHSHPNFLAFARNDKEISFLETLRDVSNDMCEKMGGGKARMVDKKTLQELEPNLTDEAIAGLYDEDNLVELFGPDYVFALIDNAKDNGARVLMSTEVQRVSSPCAYDVFRQECCQAGYYHHQDVIAAF